MTTVDFLGKEWNITCMGCAIADRTMLPPGGMIKETAHFCLHQDPLIPLPGFLVIGARRHVHALDELSDVEYADFVGVLREAQRAIKAVTEVKHLTIVQEEHSSHFHLWFFPWTDEVVERFGKPSLSSIRAIMAAYRQETLDPETWRALEASIHEIKARLKFPSDRQND